MKYIFTEIGLHKINIIILSLVFILLCIQLYATTSKGFEGFENTRRYTFIHVPKTSGSALHKVLDKYPKNFDVYSNHFHNMVATKFNRPILCIREPTDRFLSIYKYWRQHAPKFYPKINTSLKYFIQLLKKKSKFLLVGNPPFLSEYHYFQQVNYIDPSVYPYSIIIMYDKNQMEAKTNALLKYLEITEKDVPVPVKNVSLKTDVQLDDEDLQYVQEKYKDDYQLWDELQQHPEKFLKIF